MEPATELTLQDHFRRLELMTLKYAGGQFVTDAQGERSYEIATLSGADETELYVLNKTLEQAHAADSK
jgi:hypothetical protein